VLRGVGPTTGVTIVQGESAVCAWNGSDFIKISNTSGAGVFTTLSVTGVATFAAGTAAAPAITTTGDTNTGIFFPAADTIGFSEGGAEAARFDSSGNFGLGVTPSAWDTSVYKALQLANGVALASYQTAGAPILWLGANAYYNSGNKYVGTGAATLYQQNQGVHSWSYAASGTAGNAITFTQAMTLDASGNLGLGVTPSASTASGVLFFNNGGQFTFSGPISYQDVNIVYNSGADRYIANGAATRFSSVNGVMSWYNAPSGTAGNAITFTQAMTLDTSGRLLVGSTTAPSGGLPNILSANSAGGGIQFAHTSSNGGALMGGIGGGGQLFYTYTGAVGSETYTERMRLDASGNLGVGVTPSAWASVYKVVQLSGGGAFSGSTGQVNISQNFVGESGGEKYIATAPVTSYAQTAGAHRWYNAPSGTAGTVISFTQAMTLDAGGRLLLTDTSTPVADALFSAASSNTTDGAWSARVISRNTGNDTSVFMANWRTNSSTKNAVIAAHNAALTGWGNLYVNTTDGSASNSGAVIVGGNLLVGTPTAYGGKVDILQSANFTGMVVRCSDASYTTHPLDLAVDRNTTNNSYYFIRAAVTGVQYRFQVADSGNVTNINNSYGAISDIKLKENIVDATPKLAGLMQVKVRNYNLIGDAAKQLGVVAQELETVFPSMIDEAPDRDAEGNDLGTTTKSVKYSVFVPMLIKAIQEQQALITQLTARITALEGA
jgi:hypothetical protein